MTQDDIRAYVWKALTKDGKSILEICEALNMKYQQVANVFYDLIKRKSPNGRPDVQVELAPIKQPKVTNPGVYFGYEGRHFNTEAEYFERYSPPTIWGLSTQEKIILARLEGYEMNNL